MDEPILPEAEEARRRTNVTRKHSGSPPRDETLFWSAQPGVREDAIDARRQDAMGETLPAA
ncbi:hypothetical protein [Microbacterium terricola]|uniref:Uncharacterized protein n=1 Tax=Microbacterium terricola TaxID=344163 RepID=A0ABM8E2R6_9MICO|nr:hypothetical protein [Microbacterium terricola]UYK40049.1 hypothetical protein OAU46_15390 [Microbacterium terricola]BDV32257.1 hypothetical protein Microterr_29170 [Microbacterium terricola]